MAPRLIPCAISARPPQRIDLPAEQASQAAEKAKMSSFRGILFAEESLILLNLTLTEIPRSGRAPCSSFFLKGRFFDLAFKRCIRECDRCGTDPNFHSHRMKNQKQEPRP